MSATPWFRLLMLLVTAAVMTGAIVTPSAEPTVAGRVVLWVTLGVVLVVLVAVQRWFMALDVRVTGDEVVTAFGPWRKRVARGDILEATVRSYPWLRYGGWGVRFGFGGRRAWTVPLLRTGVEVALRDGTRWFISSRRPEALRAAIRP
ncbi:MAG: hypothetical protein WD734_01265 [Dehalococcoidia bacterium]